MRLIAARTMFVVGTLMLGAMPAHAQSADARTVLAPTIEALNKTRGQDGYQDLVDQVLGDSGKFVLARQADTVDGRFIVEANRLDKQVGASSRGAGTTNLVTSGSVPRILGFAVETGAITQSVSGTTVTFQTNPAGLAETLAKGAAAVNVPVSDTASQNTLNFLKRFNVGFSFDASKDKDQKFAGSYQELQQFSGQVYLYNHRDPTHPAWRSFWQTFAQSVSNDLANTLNQLSVGLENQPGFKALREDTKKRLIEAKTDADVERAILEHAEKMSAFVSAQMSTRALDEWARYLRTQNKSYASIARSQVLTAEYQFDRPPVQDAPTGSVDTATAAMAPDLSTFRVIWARPFLGPSDMTITVSASRFNESHAGIRDWQIGGKLDFPLNGIAGISKAQLTLAGLFMRLQQSPLGVPVTVNGIVVDRTGDMGFFQARLKMPLGDSGVSVPFSFTYASRTELIKDEKEIRGNVGFSLDVDKLIGRQ